MRNTALQFGLTDARVLREQLAGLSARDGAHASCFRDYFVYCRVFVQSLLNFAFLFHRANQAPSSLGFPRVGRFSSLIVFGFHVKTELQMTSAAPTQQDYVGTAAQSLGKPHGK